MLLNFYISFILIKGTVWIIFLMNKIHKEHRRSDLENHL